MRTRTDGHDERPAGLGCFVDIDQHHGFTKRIASDTTPVGWDCLAERLRQERGAVAACCGLIEQMDRNLGQMWQAFDTYTRHRSTQGIFCYLSDHGD